MKRLYIIREALNFIKHEKKWWLVPLLIAFIIIGVVLLCVHFLAPVLPVFLYPLI